MSPTPGPALPPVGASEEGSQPQTVPQGSGSCDPGQPGSSAALWPSIRGVRMRPGPVDSATPSPAPAALMFWEYEMLRDKLENSSSGSRPPLPRAPAVQAWSWRRPRWPVGWPSTWPGSGGSG